MFENAALLTEIFGRWPSFHDAEVLSVSLDRRGDSGPTLDFSIYVFEMTPEVDGEGFFVLQKHTDVVLRFTGVDLLGLAWINQQNVIEELIVSELEPAKESLHKSCSRIVSSGVWQS
jgi:Immunity protein 50